jgi:N6-adenosine-specific RNA methylase IME4
MSSGAASAANTSWLLKKTTASRQSNRNGLIMTLSASLPQGHFGCILADPPWSFRTYSKRTVAPARGEQPYAVMSLDHIKALPVADVAAKDALLFMWTVSHLQREAFDVAEAWGFKPVSVAFIWDKGQIGMGYWTRQEAEICHLFKRGKPRRKSRGVRSIIRAPRREHSRKPDEQYERIEALVDGPYLELFARQAWPNWRAWGNQVGKFDAANDNDLFSRVA